MASKKGANGKTGHDPFDAPKDYDGPDGAARQRAKAAGPGKGHNSKKFDGKELADTLDTIAAAKARMKAKIDAASKACQKDRELIKSARQDLVDSGYPSTELATLIRKHMLEIKIENIDEKLDDDQKETFAQMVEALGDFGGTELGQASIARHHPAAEAN